MPRPREERRESSPEFLDGYERALRDLEDEVLHMIGRGYGLKEMRVLFRARFGDMIRDVRDRRRRVEAPAEEKPREDGSAREPRDSRVATPSVDLSPQQTALFATGDIGPALWVVAGELTRGRKAMCVTRASPGIVRASGLGQSVHFWITTEPPRAGQDVRVVAPTDFTQVQTEMHRFLTENAGGIVLFEGYEYVKDQYRGDPTQPMRLLSALRDKAYNLGGTFVACVDPSALGEGELSRLQKCVGPVVRLQ